MQEVVNSWGEMHLDSRISEAIRALKWRKPTAVQRACVPQILKGRDVAVQSRTGTGKTGAFVVPLIQRLSSDRASSAKPKLSSLILVPSVELAQQTTAVVAVVARYFKPKVGVSNMCDSPSSLVPTTEVLVSTPASLAKALRAQVVPADVLKYIKTVVIDEADLLISMTSLHMIRAILPQSGVQYVLLSATLNESVIGMKGQLLHNPTNITVSMEEVEDGDDTTIVEKRSRQNESRTKQYYLVATDECHEHTLVYALYRLALIEGKTIIFVNEEERTYKLQHFLEQVGVNTIVYDQHLPLKSRLNMLQRFQDSEIATLICTDATLEMAENAAQRVENEESALHRGIDFSQVRNVILFDGIDAPLAANFSSYTHRIGRAGRAGNFGQSIVIFTLKQAQHVTGPLRAYVKTRGAQLRPFKQLDRANASTLQYRVDSALANVTRAATRRLRIASVASEIAHSDYLSSHIAEQDSEVLNKLMKNGSRAVKIDKSLRDVPDYMKVTKADSTRHYQGRVAAKGKAVEDSLTKRLGVKRKREDPLESVVSKIKRVEKNSSKLIS